MLPCDQLWCQWQLWLHHHHLSLHSFLEVQPFHHPLLRKTSTSATE